MIAALRREAQGSRASTRIRASGLLPGVLYGGPDNIRVPISTPKAAVTSALHARGASFLNSILTLRLDGDGVTYSVIPRHMQHNPVRPSDPISLNFLVYDPAQGVKVSIPLSIADEDKCLALKRGGTLNVLTWRVLVRFKGGEGDVIPDSIPVSLAGIKVGELVTWGNIKLPDYMKRVLTPLGGPNVPLLNILGSKAKGAKGAKGGKEASEEAG